MSAANTGVRANAGESEQCVAVNEVVALLRDKWTLLVLGALRRAESMRYSELQRGVVGISQRMLTLTLKTLEQNGLVKRTVFPSIPPRVDYQLTALGHSLVEPLQGLLRWSTQNRAAMEAARRRYARPNAR